MPSLLRSLGILAVLLSPAVVAAPILHVGGGYMDYGWSVNGAGGSCRDWYHIDTAEVQFKLLVTVQTETRGATTGRLESNCPMAMSIAPGVYTNPCDLIAGNVPAPALTTDPYFHPAPSSTYAKRINFLNGGFVDYVIRPPWPTQVQFWGSCYSPPATGASWNAWSSPVANI